ncbi:MAG: serine/threonine-protein kinase [Halopseudomonas sp.]
MLSAPAQPSTRRPVVEQPEALVSALANPRSGVATELPEILCKRYKIERLLGVGGMGAVYRARDLLREQYGDPDPYLALKTLNEEFAEYPDANALLYTEFALTSRLRHNNVIRLYAFEVDPQSQRAFISMEPLKGPTLDQLLESHPQGLRWEEYRSIALPLLEALACAHQGGVLHGDLKPSNIMLTKDGLRLFDFGLGQPVQGLLNGLPQLSRQRIAAWTPRYAALELLNGESLTSTADVYALACVLYELVSGLHPFSRLTAKQAKSMQQDKSLQKPANLPAHCWPALRQALAFDPQARQIDAKGLFEVFSRPVPGLLERLCRRQA